MTRYRLIYKCPVCNRKPKSGRMEIAEIYLIYCCRHQAGKPTEKLTLVAWNEVVAPSWSDKLKLQAR